MTPYYSDDLVTIYHGRAEDWSGEADAVVSDPPYGMDWDVNTTRFSGGSPESQKRRGKGTDRRAPVAGDTEPFDPTPWLSYPEVILWGLNHYPGSLPALDPYMGSGSTLVAAKSLGRKAIGSQEVLGLETA